MMNEQARRLPSGAAQDFGRDGFLLVRGFYDLATEVRPIQEAIQKIVGLVGKKYGVDAPCASPEEAMSQGYMTLARADRKYGSEIYDAVKQIPEFVALVANVRNSATFANLRPGAIPGIAAGGYGIRIDSPGEEKFRAPWHQEFPAQLRSLDGIVFWTPLVSIVPELGPVELSKGSHKEGPIPVFEDDGGHGKSGAYSLRLDREQERLGKYEKLAPLTEPGDLLLMDFLTMHQSGENKGTRPRWSMQFRYFNFADPTGLQISWRGSFASGVRYQDVMTELVANRG